MGGGGIMSLILNRMDLPKDEKKPLRIEIWANGDVYKDYGYGYEYKEGIATQIPKNHGNLKDIDAIYRAFSKFAENETDEGKLEVYTQLMGLLLQAPTVLEEEESEK